MQPTVQPYFDPVTAPSVTWFSSPGNRNARSLTRFSTMTQSQDALQRRMRTGSSSSCARKACTLSGYLKRTPHWRRPSSSRLPCRSICGLAICLLPKKTAPATLRFP